MCTGTGGSATDSKLLTVTSATPPVVTVSASSTTISAGQGVTITWTSMNATSCVASWTTGSIVINGSQLFLPSSSTTYTVTCTGTSGTSSGAVSITVVTGDLTAPKITGLGENPYIGSTTEKTLALFGTTFTSSSRVTMSVPRYGTSVVIPQSKTSVVSSGQINIGTTLGLTAATWTARVTTSTDTSNSYAFRVASDDYPAKQQYTGFTPSDCRADPWSFCQMNCTSFVAWRVTQDGASGFNNYYGGVRWGNASNWDVAARAIGLTVDNIASVGAVAQFKSINHVAYVVAIKPDGSIIVEDYNYGLDGTYRLRGPIATSAVTNFIHVQ